MSAACSFVAKLNANVLNPLAALIFALGLVVFIWGVVQFMSGLANEVGESKENGKRHMIYGVIGMAVMMSAYAILLIVANTFGLTVQNC